MSDLLEKALKSAIINMFKEVNKIMSKELKESVRTKYHKIQNIKRDINYKNNRIGNKELKIITEKKNLPEGPRSRFVLT